MIKQKELDEVQSIIENTQELLYSDRHGVYIPQIAVEDCHLLADLTAADKLILSDPEHDCYWEVWEECLGREFEYEGISYQLEQDGDLFVINLTERFKQIEDWEKKYPDSNFYDSLEYLR